MAPGGALAAAAAALRGAGGAGGPAAGARALARAAAAGAGAGTGGRGAGGPLRRPGHVAWVPGRGALGVGAAPEGLRVVGAAAEGAVRLAGGAAGEAGVGTGSGAGAGSGAGGGRTFGFEEGVGFEEHRERVLDVFRRVAPQYDVMNDAMSFFLHRLWKDRLVEVVQPFPGQRHLDVAGGTGDVAFRMLEGIRAAEAAARAAKAPTPESDAPPGEVTVFDINAAMLAEGRGRAERKGLGGQGAGLRWVEGDAEALPFEGEAFDSYTVSFGIRNVTDIPRALCEAFRVLRPGGHFCCLEFSQVNNVLLRELYDQYSFRVIPHIGAAVAGDPGSYQYLVDSIRTFPKQDDFAEMVRAAGFREVRYENLFDGMVAIHSGFKV